MDNSTSSVYSKFSYFYFRFIEVLCRFLARIYPMLIFDKVYCSAKYRRIFGKKLNIKNPQTFNEKIQWLKLYDRNPLYTQLADKYAVREYVKNRIGEQYLNELFGIYTSVDEIDFEHLPNRFVLKATHGCKWNIICSSKEELNIDEAKAKLAKWLKMNWYEIKGEWNYRNIPPRIIYEKFLEGDEQLGLITYMIHCFNGNPKLIDVFLDEMGKFGKPQYEAIYDTEWILQPFKFSYPLPIVEIPRPSHLDLMIKLAKELSSDTDYCRVDLYNFADHLVFGEITLFNASGFEMISPREYDFKLGDYLTLSK